MKRPTLFLVVGLPGTGKTTAARQIEVEHGALRLTKDEWVRALYGRDNPPAAQDVIEGRLVEIGLRVLGLGSDVVIDYGLWSRDERSALRQAAAELGATVQMRFFDLAPAEQRRRLDQRQIDAPATTWPMSDEELSLDPWTSLGIVRRFNGESAFWIGRIGSVEFLIWSKPKGTESEAT